MDIGMVSNKGSYHKQEPAAEARKAESAETRPEPTAHDTVQLSLDSRRRLAESADSVLLTGRADRGIGDESKVEPRLEIVKRRIESGYYDSPHVREAIADRLMNEMGDAFGEDT